MIFPHIREIEPREQTWKSTVETILVGALIFLCASITVTYVRSAIDVFDITKADTGHTPLIFGIPGIIFILAIPAIIVAVSILVMDFHSRKG